MSVKMNKKRILLMILLLAVFAVPKAINENVQGEQVLTREKTTNEKLNLVLLNISEDSEEVLPTFSFFTIISPSMAPTINVYDVIINRRVDDPGAIEIGDIITFISTSSISRNMIVTHRVIEIQVNDGKYEFITQGDNNPAPDSSPALAENIIGKTVFRIPQLGRIQFFLSSFR